MQPILTDDGSWTYESREYGETYRSRRGAAREARHVFLEGSGVSERLRRGLATSLLEIGLGTATNLVVTATAALGAGVSLTYASVERAPLPAEAWAELRLDAVGDSGFVAALLAWRRGWTDAPPPRLRYGPVEVEALIGDALAVPLPHAVDAIYLDGFSARVNPELWTPPALARFAACLAPGGVLASYSVRGDVRRALAAIGLVVERRPGPPGGKRDALAARRPL